MIPQRPPTRPKGQTMTEPRKLCPECKALILDGMPEKQDGPIGTEAALMKKAICKCGHNHKCLVCLESEQHSICGKCDCLEYRPLKRPAKKEERG